MTTELLSQFSEWVLKLAENNPDLVKMDGTPFKPDDRYNIIVPRNHIEACGMVMRVPPDYRIPKKFGDIVNSYPPMVKVRGERDNFDEGYYTLKNLGHIVAFTESYIERVGYYVLEVHTTEWGEIEWVLYSKSGIPLGYVRYNKLGNMLPKHDREVCLYDLPITQKIGYISIVDYCYSGARYPVHNMQKWAGGIPEGFESTTYPNDIGIEVKLPQAERWEDAQENIMQVLDSILDIEDVECN